MFYNRTPSYLSLNGSVKLHLPVFHSRLPDKPTLPSPLDTGNLNYIFFVSIRREFQLFLLSCCTVTVCIFLYNDIFYGDLKRKYFHGVNVTAYLKYVVIF